MTVTSSRFVPPSVEEASAYFVERGAPAGEAVRFCDFYAAKGWKVGRSPMKDWRAAVRNWLRSSDSFASGRAPEKKLAAPPAQRFDPQAPLLPEERWGGPPTVWEGSLPAPDPSAEKSEAAPPARTGMPDGREAANG